jgi:hypothetical protein
MPSNGDGYQFLAPVRWWCSRTQFRFPKAGEGKKCNELFFSLVQSILRPGHLKRKSDTPDCCFQGYAGSLLSAMHSGITEPTWTEHNCTSVEFEPALLGHV